MMYMYVAVASLRVTNGNAQLPKLTACATGMLLEVSALEVTYGNFSYQNLTYPDPPNNNIHRHFAVH